MPRKVSTGDGKRKADAAAAATQAPAKKTCPHRTPQTPFESGDKETTYIVDKMVGTRWNQGSREYLVRWKGYAASADTWEPMENLVGCAQQIREYEKLRGKEDIEAKAAVLAKRQEAKNAAAVVEADLKARAAEAALAGAGDGNASLTPAASASASLGSFVDFMSSVAHLQAPVADQVSRVKSEAHRYLELPAAPMNTDPLEWWATNEINFPALSVMARQYLGVPATSASAERLFSLAGRAFDDLRQCMKEEMLEILMWARINKEKRQRD